MRATRRKVSTWNSLPSFAPKFPPPPPHRHRGVSMGNGDDSNCDATMSEENGPKTEFVGGVLLQAYALPGVRTGISQVVKYE
jgi:hypothetical protein